MRQIPLAVIGAGRMGERHASLISQHPDCSLVGICDTNPGRQAVAARFGVPFHTSVEEVIECERPSGTIIATPTSHHASVVQTCAEHAVHMLIEKPIADTMADAQRVVQTACSCGVRVLVGYHRRHNPLVRKARELLDGGVLGRLVGVSVLWSAFKPVDYFDIDWHREPGVGGPVLINLVHDLDSLRFLCGEIREVYAQTRSGVRGLEVEDSVNIAVSFENGALGTILASDASPSPWSYEATTGEQPSFFHADENCYHFLGSEGSLAFPAMELWRYPEHAQKGWREPLERTQITVEPRDPLRSQLEHFCRVVRGEEKPVLDAEVGAASLAVALAVHESARSGLPVTPASIVRPICER